ncbi:MAG: LysM peptidoglycan-binding domain-containing protein [Litorimonas sp.]
MSARLLLLGSAFLLASCATAQENPNYQYSSKYGQTQVADNTFANPVMTPPVQTAGPQSTRTDAQTYTAGTRMGSDFQNTGYVGNEGVTLATSQSAQQPPQPTTSPTERAYNSSQMQGTPGYEMMRAQQQADGYSPAPAPDYTPYTPPVATPMAATGPRQITYDYGDNVSLSDTGSNQPSGPSYDQMSDRGRTGTAANIGTGQSYMVREGDTIYSLARRLCTPMTEITTANGIGGDYAIAIGQTLSLPNSRC